MGRDYVMKSVFGHQFTDNGVTFQVWAPNCKILELETKKDGATRTMEKESDGWFQIRVNDIEHGDRYRFRINNQVSRPDPAAHWFEESVHGWNQAVDHRRYNWQTDDWSGIPKRELIIYELHIGTFTNAGTFRSAIDRLEELVELGINAIEILPVAQCPGKWNWGYDGVGLFATQNTYGTPEDLKAFVDACHQKGIAVILDVVFNHLGPEGNYLSEFGPFFNRKRKTPWGDGLNFDGHNSKFVREFMTQCAVHWIRNYRLDGLRMDAVHFMFDDSELPISMAVTKAIDHLELDRPIHVIGETNVRNASLTKGTSEYGTGFDAVWSDGMMHCVLSIGQPGLDLCHRDHHGSNDLAIAIHQGFLYENFPYERHDAGERADLDSFVIGFQNHDTVGNHPLGHRIHQLASKEFQKAAAALYLLYPAIPMIFMGEEFAADDPFLFFADFNDPWVREGVEKGRAAEFPELHARLGGFSPLDPKSFMRSKLGSCQNGDQEMRSWYRELISIRKMHRSTGLLDQRNMSIESTPGKGMFVLKFHEVSLGTLTVAVRLGTPCPDDEASRVSCAQNGEFIAGSTSDPSTGNGEIRLNEAKIFFDSAVQSVT